VLPARRNKSIKCKRKGGDAHEQEAQKENGRSRSRPQTLACYVHLFQGDPKYVTEKPLHY